MRRIILGNASAGKTTLALRSTGARAIPILTLDQIAWEGTRRKPFEESLRNPDQFLLSHEDWGSKAATAISSKRHYRIAQN